MKQNTAELDRKRKDFEYQPLKKNKAPGPGDYDT